MQKNGLRITSEPMGADSDANHVRDMLSLYNVAKTGHDYWQPVRIFVRDSTGFIRGGLLGDIWGRLDSRVDSVDGGAPARNRAGEAAWADA